MGSDILFAEALGQMASDALGQSPRIHEYERAAMFANQIRQSIVDLRPDLTRHDRFKRGVRQLDGQVTMTNVTAVDDSASGSERMNVRTRVRVRLAFSINCARCVCFSHQEFCN